MYYCPDCGKLSVSISTINYHHNQAICGSCDYESEVERRIETLHDELESEDDVHT